MLITVTCSCRNARNFLQGCHFHRECLLGGHLNGQVWFRNTTVHFINFYCPDTSGWRNYHIQYLPSAKNCQSEAEEMHNTFAKDLIQTEIPNHRLSQWPSFPLEHNCVFRQLMIFWQFGTEKRSGTILAYGEDHKPSTNAPNTSSFAKTVKVKLIKCTILPSRMSFPRRALHWRSSQWSGLTSGHNCAFHQPVVSLYLGMEKKINCNSVTV